MARVPAEVMRIREGRKRKKKVVSRRKFDEIVDAPRRDPDVDNPFAVAHARFRKKGEK